MKYAIYLVITAAVSIILYRLLVLVVDSFVLYYFAHGGF